MSNESSRRHASIIIKIRPIAITCSFRSVQCDAVGDRWGIYRYPKYIHFHFEHYAQVEERATGARGVIGTGVGGGRGDQSGGDSTGTAAGYYQEPMI